jgi:hypothetical protein
MSKWAQLADGTWLEFPDNTSDAVIDRAVQAHVNNPRNSSRAKGLAGGAVKPVDNLASWASQIPVLGPAVDQLGQALGLPSTADAVANNDAMRANNTRKGYQLAGNVAGTLPLAALPGGAATQGAAGGALLSDSRDTGGFLTDVAIGAAGGKLGQVVGNAVGAIAAPRISSGARRLANAGIMQTPGQIMAGSKNMLARQFSKAEEALTSTPYLGDMINMAREAGTEGYNRALGNRVLSPLGANVPRRLQPGEGFVDGIRSMVGRRYDRLVPSLRANFNKDFVDVLQNAKALTNVLPDQRQQQFGRIVQDVFMNRATGPGNAKTQITGQALKDAESRLTGLVRQYSSSADADERVLGEALQTVRTGLRSMVERSNPESAAELQNLNRAWAQLRPMRAASDAAPDGVITPQRMFQANRQARYRGDKLTNAAAARLRNATPDSGTPRRAAATLAAANIAGLAGGAAISPALAIPAALSLLYTRPGMAAVNKAVFAPRGPVAQTVAKAARAAPALIPGLGPLAVMGLLGRLGE